MFNHLVTLLFVVLNVSEIFCTFSIFDFIDNVDSKVVRVRTPEERDRRSNEFAVLDFIGLVEQHWGYTAEEYNNIVTPDGYVLTLHRITGSPFSPAAPGKPVVYMQHGFLASSDFFVMFGPQKDLAFELADAGYDVWVGNARGNTYTKQHINYASITLNNKKFWNFSLDEMGTIDLPVYIDTILRKTNKKKLTYIGVSMGTTISYILLSSRPEYNDKINLVVSITPVAFFTQPASNLQNMLANYMIPIMKSFGLNFESYQVLPQSKVVKIVGKNFCAQEQTTCSGVMSMVMNLIVHSNLPTLFSHMPAGTSLNTLDHFYQLITSGKFQKYRPGVRDPLVKFTGTTEAYDLSKISSPQALFYSNLDAVASPRGVKKLKKKMKNCTIHEVYKYNHMDFMWAHDGREAFYNDILRVIHDTVRD